MPLARLAIFALAGVTLAAASVPCAPSPEWVERAQATAEMPCHQEAHAAHATRHHDAEWKTPCPCGCGGRALPSARGGRLGFALALAPPPSEPPRAVAAVPLMSPRLPAAPHRLHDPVPI